MQSSSRQIDLKTNGKEMVFSFPSDPFLVRDVLSDLRKKLVQHQVPDADIDNAEIVLGETLNNIVEHAYPDGKDGDIRMRYLVKPDAHEITIRDFGLPMPDLTLPTGAAKPDDCLFEDMPEGGFGWFMIRTLTQKIDYQRQDGSNQLRFVLPIEVSGTPAT